ncbi:helix-turn-helix transcriptional regulator [Isoptericola dokdonensis]|uniref:Oxygen regulatory protein NreC n=1 Tax=Isoptericola dokdonensis DS-3 TaxID=1300344 RepID=A0A161IG16_9MICO|nr:helix-turn-helix transcriptional regulator [Isoptericola dokdonensis]ANC32497.1 Oxygen regulatory protein NreC [Isoptericola dokdonensis DS-3]
MTSHTGGPSLVVAPRASGAPVAPHVATTLGRFGGDDDDAVDLLAAALDRDQLSGTVHLPELLPVPARPAPPTDPTVRHVALLAALAVTDRVDLLVRAAGCADDELLDALDGLLEMRHGRFRPADPGRLEGVRAGADLDAVTAAHRDLSRAARAVGEPGVALWHTARGTVTGDELLADGLVELAGVLLRRGDPGAAYDVACEAVSHGTGERRARAFLLAGRSALWSGHLVDARRWLHRARRSGTEAVEAAAGAVLAAVDLLLDGRAPGPVPASGPGESLATLVGLVAVDAPGPVDRAVLADVVTALRLLDRDPAAAASLVALAAVRAVPAWSRPGTWADGTGHLTPLAEAHLRVVQSLLLFCGEDSVAAAAVLDDAAARLPVAHVVGGLAVEVGRRLDHDREGARSRATHELSRIAPRRQVAAGAVAALRRGGAAAPDGAAAVARATTSLAGEPARGPGAARPAPCGDELELPAGWAELLTVREVEVTRLVVDGLANREVAQRLCVSVRTVEVHLGRAFRKLGVRSRSELVVLALRPAR